MRTAVVEASSAAFDCRSEILKWFFMASIVIAEAVPSPDLSLFVKRLTRSGRREGARVPASARRERIRRATATEDNAKVDFGAGSCADNGR
jgi:hypothetical protein